ncbi:MAG: LysE family transporter [Myxococcota bacterium]|nr:LysE family transporter [Myxococcota bacterium]
MPGPFQAYLLSQSLRWGWRLTLPVALAPLVSDGPIICLVLLVLSLLSKQTLGIIQIAGGVFILYLAYDGTYRSTREVASEQPVGAASARSSVKGGLKGAAMNALNPAPYIFWSTVGGPILLTGWRESPGIGIAFLVGFYGTLIVGFGILIWFFGTAGGLNPKVKKALSAISAIALLTFGLLQFYLGVRGIGA